MRYLAYTMMIAAALVLSTSPAMADQQDSGACQVLVNIVSNVSVSPDAPTVTVDNIQTGLIDVSCVFNVQANVQLLDLSVQASDLYKHSDSSYTIPLNIEPDSVDVQNEQGEPVGGASTTLTFDPALTSTVTANGRDYPAIGTPNKTYGSGQGELWDQQVTVAVSWNQGDNTLPTGQYSGAIQLTAMVTP